MERNPYHEQHWVLKRDAAGIAWLTLDQQDSAANVLSGPVLNELDWVISDLAANLPKGLIIRSAKGSGFIAGADIKEFTTFNGEAHARDQIRRALPIFRRLERLPCPTVAVIHGFCLGGGLELALACDYRVAEEAPKTQLGLPEVKLGIHPGFGGTVRLPRIIGHLQALGMMLTGRTLSARAARKLGLVDRTAPHRQLERTALDLVEKHPPLRRAGLWSRIAGSAPVRPLVAAWLKHKTESMAPARHYPAPHAMIDLWNRWSGQPEKMLEEEAASVASLITGQTAGNLVRLFLLRERLRGLGKNANFKPQRLHVVGAGVMGGDIAAWCALNGLVVTLQDRNNDIIGRAIGRAAALFQKKLRDPRRVRDALDRLIPDPRGDGIPKADVVIEAIFENLEAKQALLAKAEPRLKAGALLATNTSSISLEQIAGVLKRPERFVGLHFFNPVAKMPLLEVVAGQQSDAWAVKAGCAFAVTVNRSPLPVKSGPGFLINRILMPYLLEAVNLVAEGFDPETVDEAAVAFGMPMGPIVLADVVGLDICLSVADNLATTRSDPVPDVLRERVALGHLGRKSGRGFYAYRNGVPARAGKKGKTAVTAALEDRLFSVLLNESVACLREGVVTDPDLLDAGVVFGTGFAPFRGGPMRHIAQVGKEGEIRRLRELEKRYGTRFTPDPGWDLLPIKPQPGNREHRYEQTRIEHHPALAGGNVVRFVPGTG